MKVWSVFLQVIVLDWNIWFQDYRGFIFSLYCFCIYLVSLDGNIS